MRRHCLLALLAVILPAAAAAQVIVIPPYTSGSGASCAGFVTPSTYGSATHVPVLTVDANGCITTLTTASIFDRGTLTSSNPFRFRQTWNNGAISDFRGFEVSLSKLAGSGKYFSVRVDEDADDAFSVDAVTATFRGVAGFYSYGNDGFTAGVGTAGFGLQNAMTYASTAAGRAYLRRWQYAGPGGLEFQFGGKPTWTPFGGEDEELDGLDSAWVITVGEGPGTTATVTFQLAYTNPPVCTIVNSTTGVPVTYTITAAAISINAVVVAGDKIQGTCTGFVRVP